MSCILFTICLRVIFRLAQSPLAFFTTASSYFNLCRSRLSTFHSVGCTCAVLTEMVNLLRNANYVQSTHSPALLSTRTALSNTLRRHINHPSSIGNQLSQQSLKLIQLIALPFHLPRHVADTSATFAR